MMKRVLLALVLLMLGQIAWAGPYTVAQQTPVYTDAHPIQAHDAAAAYGYEPADISGGFTTSTWIHGSSTCPSGGCGAYLAPGTGSEGKARFDCNAAGHNNDDPIIYPGVQGGSPHEHTTFGNLAFANSMYNATYAALRVTGNSTCYGGPLNRTLYWEPSMKKLLPSGYAATIIPKNIVTYYEACELGYSGVDYSKDCSKSSRWPRSIEFIEGFNMNDPTNSRVTDIVAALNAAAGWAKYSTVGAGSAGGFVGWFCYSVVSGTLGPVSALKDGAGNPTLNCTANTDIYAELLSDPCWDGVNFTSPNGRLHMMPYIRDNNASRNVCPDNWVRVMQFRAKVTFSQTGQSDYSNWWASSDRMVGMTQFLNGQSMHFDLIPAWDYGTAASPGVFLNFSNHCDGTPITISGTTMATDPHECAYGRIDQTENVYVNEASPDASSPNPIVNLSPNQTGTLRYFTVTPGSTGTGHLHHGVPCTSAVPCQSMNDNMPANDNQTRLAGAVPIDFNLRGQAGR
jgi:hypothetical protein